MECSPIRPFYNSEFRATEFRFYGIAVVIRGSESERKALEKDRRRKVGLYESSHDHYTATPIESTMCSLLYSP
jgi:hypothetical protein